jgi:tetratricopeptide (TPR) repeat protein
LAQLREEPGEGEVNDPRMASMRNLISIFAATAFAATAFADNLLMKDGRYFEVPKLVAGQENFEVIYPHGVVRVPNHMVKESFIAASAGEYKPKDDEEAKKLAQGLVPHDGKWITKQARDAAIAKRTADAKAKFEEAKKHSEWKDRYKKSTAHFDFEYTVTPELGQKYMDMFEVYYATFAKTWNVKQPAGKKLKVCFYNNFQDYTRIGNAPGSLGYFRFVEPIELNFFYERRDERLTLDVLFHELNHYLFHLYTTGDNMLPAWIEEGMAEYYGASEWDPATKTMKLGVKQEGRLVALSDAIDGGELQDLPAMMSLPAIDALQYAWSWSLCHMLIENPKTKDKFIKFVQRMAQDEKLKHEVSPRNSAFTWVPPATQIDLFQKTLGIKDLAAFQKEWYDYIKAMKVESARGYHSAAMKYIQWDRPVRARIFLEKAVSAYADNPLTYLELGKLYHDEKKFDKAVAMFEKSIQLDPFNPAAYLRLGKARVELGGDEFKKQGQNEQLLAIDIDPYDPSLLFQLDSEVLAQIKSG